MSSPTRPAPMGDSVRYPTVRLAVTHGPDAGLELEAAGRLVRVGTAPDNDIVLSDDAVSRRHCEVELTEAGFRVRDLGSTNGVRALGARIYDAAFDGTLALTLGASVLTITPLAAHEQRMLSRAARFGELRGASRPMRALFAQLELLAQAEHAVLIEGESGSGKRLVAEALGRAGARAGAPFCTLHCGAIDPTQIARALFGSEGAADAVQPPGMLEAAHGGTLLLHDVHALPAELQARLLGVCRARALERAGGTVPADVRLLCASARNVQRELARGALREDLYRHVATARVRVPALRERLDDIPVLVEHFLALGTSGLALRDVPAPLWEWLAAHRWPGNVRELRQVVERLAPLLVPAAGA